MDYSTNPGQDEENNQRFNGEEWKPNSPDKRSSSVNGDTQLVIGLIFEHGRLVGNPRDAYNDID